MKCSSTINECLVNLIIPVLPEQPYLHYLCFKQLRGNVVNML